MTVNEANALATKINELIVANRSRSKRLAILSKATTKRLWVCTLAQLLPRRGDVMVDIPTRNRDNIVSNKKTQLISVQTLLSDMISFICF